jgi:hypothetical protein
MAANYTEPLTFPLYADCAACGQLVYRNMSLRAGAFTLFPWVHFGTRSLHDHEVTEVKARVKPYRETKP